MLWWAAGAPLMAQTGPDTPVEAPGAAAAPALACPQPALAPVAGPVPDREQAPIHVEASAFDASKLEAGIATGRVELFRADQQLFTETLQFDPRTRVITVPGSLRYRDARVTLEATSAHVDLERELAEFHAIDFGIVGSTANGAAASVRIDAARRISYLDRSRFTTCPGDNPEWLLGARELELHHAEGYGVARGAQLRLAGIPVFYTPWMSFPIDDRRRSGFLYPRFGNTNDNGVEFSVPYYWNFRPNQDATFIPRWYSDRGFMLSGEYRFLSPRSEGTLDYSYMPDDRLADTDRYHYLGRFRAALNPRWKAEARIERVSDDAYFEDFGANLALTSRQYLRSNAGLDGAGRYWIFSTLLDDFQVIDDAVRPGRLPYRRLPRSAFLLEAPLGRQGFMIDLDAEAVYFHRDAGITGARLDVYPSLVWNLYRYWGFVRASAGYRHTRYELDLEGAAGDASPDRGLPIVSLDAGMYFERERENGDSVTLEPRLYYLHVPFEDQDHLPDFDSGEFTFGFAQLFHYNRFTGADRQTDANQLTLAASTRSISARSGRETWNLNFGQILYFEPPRVTLEDETPPHLDSSPFIADLNWSPLARLFLRLGLQWDWEDRELDVGSAGVGYATESGHRLAFEYRFRRDRLDQVDVRYYWPLNERWKLYSRVNYSLDDSQLLEAIAGVEYESCCWAVRLAARRYLKDRQGGSRDAIYFELQLKGLGSIGREAPPLFSEPAP